MSDLKETVNNIPEKNLKIIAQYLKEWKNLSKDGFEFGKPHLRVAVVHIYPFFICIYGLLIILGIIMNISMIYHISKNKKYKNPTYVYLINIAVSDIIQCIFVLPMTLTVLLIYNWIFGRFLCYFIPMMQDVTFHVSMMTYLLIAADRYCYLSDPRKPRIPAFVCSLGSWIFAVCIVLPYPIYISYFDYENFNLKGLELCIGNPLEDIQQYIRGLFLLTYVAPLTVTASIFVKASRSFQDQEEPLAMFETTRAKSSCSRQNSNISSDVTLLQNGKHENKSLVKLGRADVSNFSYDVEIDVKDEKRTQKYLMFMVTAYGILLCPLMILRLATLILLETYDNSGHFDITYLIFVWTGFISTLTTPILYALWQMSKLII